MIYLLRMVLLLAVLSGLVHIFAIIATPFLAEQKVWQRVVERAPEREMVVLKDHTEAVLLLGQADPAMAYGICRFDLEAGKVTLAADGPTDFWNVTIFNDQAEIIYSLHDGVSQTQQLNLEIRNRQDTAKEENEAVVEEIISPQTEEKNEFPVPRFRPSADDDELQVVDSEEEQDEEENQIEEDGSVVRARLNVSQAFVVFKVFRSSQAYSNIVRETLTDAECK